MLLKQWQKLLEKQKVMYIQFAKNQNVMIALVFYIEEDYKEVDLNLLIIIENL